MQAFTQASGPRPIALAVMAKLPRAGSTKTRLSPPLTPDQAAGVARALLRDSFARLRGVADARPHFVFTGGSAEEAAALAGPSVALLEQHGDDLGARMANAAADLLATHRAVLILGADTLDMEAADLDAAAALLDAPGDRAVLGPATDGGYWLLGLKQPHHAAFKGMAWSTPRVLRDQLESFARLGVPVGFAATRTDLDTPDQLAALSPQRRAALGL
jgi:uncharacterized protein